MKTKFCELHFRGRSTLHKIGEFCLSDHGRQPQFSQNSILARSKAKIRNWKIINCFFVYTCQTLFTDNEVCGKIVLFKNAFGDENAFVPNKTRVVDYSPKEILGSSL